MADMLTDSLRVISGLNEQGVEYVVIGGVAMNIHGLLHATQDLDLFVRATAENVAALKRALRGVWEDPNIEEISADDLCGEYPAVPYVPPTGELSLDILTRLGEFAGYGDHEAEVVTLEEVPVRVATPATLVWMEQGTVRPIDHADANRLRVAFDIPEDG